MSHPERSRRHAHWYSIGYDARMANQATAVRDVDELMAQISRQYEDYLEISKIADVSSLALGADTQSVESYLGPADLTIRIHSQY